MKHLLRIPLWLSLVLAGLSSSLGANPLGMGLEAQPVDGDLYAWSGAAAPGASSAVQLGQDGRRYIVVSSGESFKQISQRAYGTPDLWYLIYYNNRHLFVPRTDANGQAAAPPAQLVLMVPPPPRDRITPNQDGSFTLASIPGDTFDGIAADLYHNSGLWIYPYMANRGKLPNPSDPRQIFEEPPKYRQKELLIPSEQSGALVGSASMAMAPFPPSDPRAQGQGFQTYSAVPASALVPSAADRQGPANGTILGLNLTSPSQIDAGTAERILEHAGFLHSRVVNYHTPPARNALEAGLRALYWGRKYSKPSGVPALNAEMQGFLFKEYQNLRAAQEKYQGWPEISKDAHPQAYQGWIVQAAQHLTELPEAQRIPLMQSLMTTESGKTHWKDYRPVVSFAGAVGFGQFLPQTAEGLGINPYDPAENIAGIAKYLNELIQKSEGRGLSGSGAVRRALAEYNGGNSPPQRSFTQYADGIMSRVSGLA